MNRRNFLRTTGAFSIPALLSGGLAANPAGLFTQFINQDSDRVLVLIRLAGGNDSLNTLIGLDQLDNLRQVRANIALSAASTLPLTTTTGLHGSMTGMKALFDAGKLGAVQAVGYPNQNRSHFRSTDIWTSGSEADVAEPSGWLGRYLELNHAGFPTGYPNAEFPYPLAMTMGNVVSSTCQGLEANLSVVVKDPFSYQYIAPGGDTPLPDNMYGDEISYIRTLIGQSNEYGAIVQEAANNGSTLATTYTNGSLSGQLRDIATLISGGLGTKIYIATLGGFDTHDAQTNGGNNLGGRHGELMTELSGAISGFVDDLEQLGISNRVLGLTFSEFGRRIRDNDSAGTDHGDAGALFLFGDCVQGGILGSSPEIDTQVDQRTGVPFQYDFRDVYGSVLIDWFEVPEPTVQTLFGNTFSYLPIAGGCDNQLSDDMLQIGVYTDEDPDVTIKGQVRRGGKRYAATLERSTDGRNFRPLRRFRATIGDEVTELSFRDKDVSGGQLYYYRFQLTGADGTTEYSSVQTARLRGYGPGAWTVGLPRPNPVSPASYIKVYAPRDAYVSYEILDQHGRKVRDGNVNLLGGRDNRVPLGAGKLPAGTYSWRLRTGDGAEFVRKLVVGR